MCRLYLMCKVDHFSLWCSSAFPACCIMIITPHVTTECSHLVKSRDALISIFEADHRSRSQEAVSCPLSQPDTDQQVLLMAWMDCLLLQQSFVIVATWFQLCLCYFVINVCSVHEGFLDLARTTLKSRLWCAGLLLFYQPMKNVECNWKNTQLF